MKKNLLLLFLTLFSFSAIHAAVEWGLSDDGTLTISGTEDVDAWLSSSYGMTEKVKKVVIEEGVTGIGPGAFSACTGLTSVTIPTSVTYIGQGAFSYCKKLISVTIPKSVTRIDPFGFQDCTSLSSITFMGTKVPTMDLSTFTNVSRSIPVYVPSISIDEYKNALGGLGFSNIQANTLSLKDNEAYNGNSQIENVDVSYTRNFTNTNWQALYLPFSLSYDDWKDDFEIAYINAVRQEDKNDDGKIDKTVLEFVKMNGGSTAPNTPYLIRAKKKGEKTITVENTTVYPAEYNSMDCSTTTATFTFTGIYASISSPLILKPLQGYIIGNNETLGVATKNNHLKAYQWYMTISSRSSIYNISNSAKEMPISICVLDEEEATGIDELRITNYSQSSSSCASSELPVGQSSVYDMNGRKVSEKTLKPGMYIKNGKKFIVK